MTNHHVFLRRHSVFLAKHRVFLERNTWFLVNSASGCALLSPHDERPDKQTLERLVCTSICEAYPDRTPAVRAWLDSRPDPPEGLDHKAHAWSHMAGWFAENGCDDFFKALWRDDRVRVVLERRLRAEGAWDLVTALV